MNTKNAGDIIDTYEKIKDTITRIQKATSQALETQRNEYCEILDSKLEALKDEIAKIKAKKGEK